MYALAIDVYTGNMYYGEAQGEFGDRIMLCNSEVQNCVTIASSPAVVSYPIGIAVHVQRRYSTVTFYIILRKKAGFFNRPGFNFRCTLILVKFTGQMPGL